MVYLDNAATTRVCPEAAEAAVHMMTECFGNPSTTYKLGREAKAAVDKARGQIAKALGCQPDEVYFTSCGSEGDNWALISGARYMRRRGKHIISSAVEHDAVRKSLDFLEKEGYEITRLQPDGTGAIPLEAVRAALRPDTILVSLMMVNNETGAVNDIAAVARMLKAENSIALLHTDAVQGFLKVPFSAKTLGADMITISGHKIHAPKGIGALYIRSGLKLPPYILGGGQERGLRSGTELVFLAAGFARAVELAQAEHEETLAHVRALSAQIRAELARLVPDAIVNSPEDASPFIVSVSVPGLRNAKSVAYLSDRGVYASRASACESNHEHVAAGTWRKKHPLSLQAAGIPLSRGYTTLRVSFSGATTPDDVDRFVATLAECNAELGSRK